MNNLNILSDFAVLFVVILFAWTVIELIAFTVKHGRRKKFYNREI
jgi:hypothetical protein